MIGRPPRRRRFDPVKAQLSNIQCIDEGIDHANRIALVNPVIEAFRQKRRLRPIRPCNEALHQFPRRIIRRILAAPAFSHSQGQGLSSLHSSGRLKSVSAVPPIPGITAIDRSTYALCLVSRVGPNGVTVLEMEESIVY